MKKLSIGALRLPSVGALTHGERYAPGCGQCSVSPAGLLFLLSFLTVYREVFETLLLYSGLWPGGNGVYMLAGLPCDIAALAGIAIILLRSSTRLPISKFCAVSSALVVILAFVLIGKGVAALQKVGVFEITPIAIAKIDLLGIYPSVQTLSAQALLLIVILVSVKMNLRTQRNSQR